MKNLEKLWHFKISLFPGLEIFFFKHQGILFHKYQVLNLCVYRIVLLIPAAFEFIMREIPANIYWI